MQYESPCQSPGKEAIAHADETSGRPRTGSPA
ncbi:hypothetical protein RHECNPAF_850020 [Rhizobium etli CNPAF512]|nr:hypothetical protein RHECNPAF_850020 [Rhizobium etli CNPAF512]